MSQENQNPEEETTVEVTVEGGEAVTQTPEIPETPEPEDFSGLSDEEFLAKLDSGEGVVLGDPEESKGEEVSAKEDSPSLPGSRAPGAKPSEDKKTKEQKEPEAQKTEAQTTAQTTAQTQGDTQARVATPEEMAAFYAAVTSPIKASGRTLQVRSPEEAIRLMQFGADYNRKMQQLAPQLKAVKMLENHGLLDNEKLSHLIEVAKGNPEAVRKLLKDAKIDPMDVDPSEGAEYQVPNHSVSDAEMAFSTVLDDVMSTQNGKETVKAIEQEWDQESKKHLFQNPGVLKTINDQRENGIYSQITGEVERLKILGVIDRSVPFLTAYKAVGDELHKQGRLTVGGRPTNQAGAQPRTQQPSRPQQQPMDRRSAPPPPQATNGDKAKAAASVRTVPAKARVNDADALARMSDADFMRAMEGRG